MKDENSTIEALIKGGLIGAALGALLSKDKEEGAAIGALVGAAISATVRANADAQKTNVPLYIEENSKLFEVHASGERRFIKDLKKPTQQFPGQFKLK
jgi:hypothetical protein